MLLALLLPDPHDPACPEDFKAKARTLLSRVQGRTGPRDKDLQKDLLKFIGDFADWDLAADPTHIEVGRGLVTAAHGEEPPLVADPFAGGGSIPLEALRLGCDTFASDLNPVACLILKILLDDIPRHGRELAEYLARAGEEIARSSERELGEIYPAGPDGRRPIAYLWARTVHCEAPRCGAEIPLLRSFWLCKKDTNRKALRPRVVRSNGSPPHVEFEIFSPTADSEVALRTVSRARASCIACKSVLPADRVRAQLAVLRGGGDAVFDSRGRRIGGAVMLAVVIGGSGNESRDYRLPTQSDYDAVRRAQVKLASILDDWERGGKVGLSPIPDELISMNEIRRISLPLYGMTTWGDPFTMRQKVALAVQMRALRTGSALSDIRAPIASKMADTNSTVCTWQIDPPRLRATFSRQALPMTWDFAEACPLGDGAGNQALCVQSMREVVQRHPASGSGSVSNADACASPLPSESVSVYFTDPPYYDSVPYSHLSDFFYVWLRRVLQDAGPASFAAATTPKDAEIVVDRPHALSSSKKGVAFYEGGMARAFAEGRRILREDGIGAVVFAHKTTEGWEALLSGMISGGWTITGSWPIATELGSRANARETAALATSVHLVCRPRSGNAPVGDWGTVLRELPRRIGDWMERLSSEGVRGADLVFACIGPAMEVYSRHSRVEDAEGRVVPLGGDAEAIEPHLRGFLAYVWETVGRIALGQVLGSAEARARNGGAGALEEDARLTALFLWTLQGTEAEPQGGSAEESEESEDDDEGVPAKAKGGLSLMYDVVRRFSQPLGIHLEQWDGRIITIEKGIVRLTPVSDRAETLFGEEGASVVAGRIEAEAHRNPQMAFEFFAPKAAEVVPVIRGRSRGRKTSKSAAEVSDERLAHRREATTLDRVHAAMLLQAAGRTNALRALLKAEVDRGPDFSRLANALTALYPPGCEEKRLLDAMLLAMPR